MDHQFVRRHHDSRIRNLSDQLNGKTTVQASVAFLLKDHAQGLPESSILGAFFS